MILMIQVVCIQFGRLEYSGTLLDCVINSTPITKTSTRTHTHTRAHTRTRTHTHIIMHTHTRTHTHTYTHAYVCSTRPTVYITLLTHISFCKTENHQSSMNASPELTIVMMVSIAFNEYQYNFKCFKIAVKTVISCTCVFLNKILLLLLLVSVLDF